MTDLNLSLAVIGCCMFSVALHFRKPGEPLKYGPMFGLAENLTRDGKILFFLGLILVLTTFVF